MSSNKNGSLFSLFAGVVAGAAIGYYMSTEDGKKTRRRMQKEMDRLNTNVKNSLKEQTEKLSDSLSGLSEKAKNQAEILANKVKSKINDAQHSSDRVASKAEEEIDDLKTSFRKGIEKAEANLKN